MNTRRYNTLNIVATGVVVLVLLSLGLFWMHLLCRRTHHHLLVDAIGDVRIQPSGLFEFERGEAPDIVIPSGVSAQMTVDVMSFAGLGIIRDVQRYLLEGPDSYTYVLDSGPDGEWLRYDPLLGQMVYQGTAEETGPDGKRSARHFTYYAGPEGVSETSAEELGRFVAPIASRHTVRPWIVYDRGLRRFFAIDWQDRAIRSGPELPQDDVHRPVQVGALEKNPLCLNVIFEPPSFQDPRGEAQEAGIPAETPARGDKPIVIAGPLMSTDRILVLDASGRIDLLDSQRLEFAGTAGYIPAPTPLFGSARPVGPDEVAAFSVLPISRRDRDAASDWRYAGCAVAAISRDGAAMRLGVFDATGQPVAGEEAEVPKYTQARGGAITQVSGTPSGRALYFAFPAAPALTVVRFALQNLHSPALLLLSYFTASSPEATAGGRSLFLLPDSFVAMKARDRSSRHIDRFFTTLFLMLPSIALGAMLAERVGRDAARMGLSANARLLWMCGTVLFGLAAYITYRLTMPPVTLVTCQNCGRGRRPDRERCHRCDSPWIVPELIPPAWRVLGVEEPDEDGSPSQAEEVGSPAE